MADQPQTVSPIWRDYLDKKIGVALVVLLAGFVIFAYGVGAGKTGDDRYDTPTMIESLRPLPDAVQAPSQSNIFVDLQENYTGVLIIDDVEIETVNIENLASLAGVQVELPPVTIFEPGNNTLTFTPGPEAPVTELSSGEHQIELLFWEQLAGESLDEGRVRARRYIWTITVV